MQQAITSTAAVSGLVLTTGAAGHPSLLGIALQAVAGLGLLAWAGRRARHEEAKR